MKNKQLFTIVQNTVSELEILKSKFLSFAFFVESELDVQQKLQEIKLAHHKATHVCFAYKLPTSEKMWDDGEPTYTAGKPILNTIQKQNLQNVLVVVVRYFGGVKLGAGGLVRAYGNAAKAVLTENNTCKLQPVTLQEICVSYDAYNNTVLPFAQKNQIPVLQTSFSEMVTVTLGIREGKQQDFLAFCEQQSIASNAKEQIWVRE